VSRSKRVSARSSDNKRRRLKDHERLVSPKPSRCQFGVADRMPDRLVTQIALDRAGIDALIWPAYSRRRDAACAALSSWLAHDGLLRV